jgi:hypothetical protein
VPPFPLQTYEQDKFGRALNVRDLVDEARNALAAKTHFAAVDIVTILAEGNAPNDQALWPGRRRVREEVITRADLACTPTQLTLSDATTLRLVLVHPTMQATSSRTASDLSCKRHG